MPITADSKKKHLKSLSLALRHELEGYFENGQWHPGDLEQRLMSLGVRRERDALPLDEMVHLPDPDQRARKKVDQYIALRTAAGMSREGAVAEFVRETAYTWANRLLALRCMEARELIDEVILQKEVYSGRSLEHNRLLRARPELASQEDDGLFLVLEQAFSRMAQHLPLLFDPHAPSVALRPSPAALKRCITLLSSGDGAVGAVFREPDALGWAYQFWNTEENKRVFEAVRLKKAKIAGADIIPATQLYTEPYMVKFLVQNSLGATWMGMHPESKLAAGWEYFVRDADRAPIAETDRKKVAALSFLDPACGSGHFLLEAFDLLFDMYKEEGLVTDDVAICQSILEKNLYGIDIDERAVQIAEAALWCKAKERAFDFTSAKTNLVATNLRLPKDKNHLQSFLDKHPEDKPLADALEKVFAGLENADQLGSLLQIAEPVEKELRAIKEKEDKKQLAYLGNKQRTLFDAQPGSKDPGMRQFDISPQTVLPVGVENWDTWRKQTGERLRTHFAQEAEAADLGQQFFSAQASRGWRLFELLGRRYDIVAANPPYMGSKNMGPVLRKYVEQHYETGKRDLYAAFILRCIELCAEGGRVAMVTQQSWMFLRSYASLRADREKKPPTGLLYTCTLDSLAHLGRYAFSEIGNAAVAPVLFVLQLQPPNESHSIWTCRLTAPRPSEQQSELIRQSVKNLNMGAVSQPKQKEFLAIPQSPLCYWLSSHLFQLLSGTTLREFAYAGSGFSTGDNDRFLRYWWESIGLPSCAPYSKGGGYCKWDGLSEWTLRYQACKIFIATTKRGAIRNLTYQGKGGLTYTENAQGSLGVRLLDVGSYFDAKGPGIFAKSPTFPAAAILNTRVCSYLLRALTQTLDFDEAYIPSTPVPVNALMVSELSGLQSACILAKQNLSVYIPTNRKKITECANKKSSLTKLFLFHYEELLRISAWLHSLESKIEHIVCSVYCPSNEDLAPILAETGTPAGWYPFIEGYDRLPRMLEVLHKLLAALQADVLPAKNVCLPSPELHRLRQHLRSLFEAGPGATAAQDELVVGSGDDEEEEESLAGARIPIPAETFLEELSQKLEIHPISVYWLLKEGIEKEGWRCIPEEQRFVTDQLTVTILRLLGHRWPRQVEAGEAVPDWADQDGIIPITAGTQEATLGDRVRARIAADFPGGDVASIEREFAEIMGKPLDRWIEAEFFKHHTQQFKKRPIAWQLQSSKFTAKRKPAFACLLYYHKLDGDTLPKLRSQYVGPLRQRLETELRGIEAVPKDSRSDRQTNRLRELADQLSELRDFDKGLEHVQSSGFTFAKLAEQLRAEPIDALCSPDGIRPPPGDHADFLRQEQSYLPDINDGVRVNIAPLQQAGLLAADVLASKDLDKAITDRATWRSDERRWSRSGKLPQPGYFRVKAQDTEDDTGLTITPQSAGLVSQVTG